MARNASSNGVQDFMVGPVNQSRVIIQACLLLALMIFGVISQGFMVILFFRFKSLRCLSNYLLIDLTIVGFLDIVVNIPLFMQYFLFTNKADLSRRRTRCYMMLSHRFFLLNDLLTQLAIILDCFLAIKFGKRFTPKKSTINVSGFTFFKWAAILGMPLVYSLLHYASDEELVTEEAYQRVLFGPNQMIWKIVIPSCLGSSIALVLMTNRMIKRSRLDVSKHYGMRVFGKGSKNSSKAVITLLLIMMAQTLCRIPATAYSYLATDKRVEQNRWFAFCSYFFLFLSSSILPVIYYTRTKAFKRAFIQLKKHPCADNAYLDYAATYAVKEHRNGCSINTRKSDTRTPKGNVQECQEELMTPTEETKQTDLSSKTMSRHSLPSISEGTEGTLPEMTGTIPERSFLAGKTTDDLDLNDYLSQEMKAERVALIQTRRCFSDSKMFEMRAMKDNMVDDTTTILQHCFQSDSDCFSEDDANPCYTDLSEDQTTKECYKNQETRIKHDKSTVLGAESIFDRLGECNIRKTSH